MPLQVISPNDSAIQLDYAPPQAWEIREWALRHRHGLIRGVTLLTLVIWLAMNPIWMQSVTIDRLNQFDAVRDTAIGIGPATLFHTSRAVPFRFANLVDPLALPVKLPPPYSFPYQLRDKTSYWFGLMQSRIPTRVQCARGLWSFDPPEHAIQFVKTNAIDLDHSKRTALAEAILQANVQFNFSYDRNVVQLADENAWRLLKGMKSSRKQEKN